jgi:MoxR-like ATPase
MPALPETLAREVVAFVQRLRTTDLTKVPGIAETLDWAAALVALGAARLEPEQIDRTLGALVKYQEDLTALRGPTATRILHEARAAIAG